MDVTWELGEGAEKAPVRGSRGRHWVPRPLACHLLQHQRERGESRAAWPHPLHQTLQLRRHAWPQFPHLFGGKRAQMGTPQDPATSPNSALTVLGPSPGPGSLSTPQHPSTPSPKEPRNPSRWGQALREVGPCPHPGLTRSLCELISGAPRILLSFWLPHLVPALPS